MAYRLQRGEGAAEGVRRIGREQLDEAIAAIVDEDLDRARRVHEVRKRCKKLRGLLRLVRTADENACALANEWLRDTARGLSAVRDADVLATTLDRVFEDGTEDDRESVASIRDLLVARRRSALADAGGAEARLAAARTRLEALRERVATWAFDDPGAFAEGLARTYRRARRAMRRAADDPSPERFHEWRKRVKYHSYHLRLLAGPWPEVIGARRREVERLGELLGEEHDAAVLAAHVTEERLGDPWARDLVSARAASLGERLRAAARQLGERLFVERPQRFTRRIEAWWTIWCAEGAP